MIRTSLMKILMWAIIPIALTLVFFATIDFKAGGAWVSLVFVWLAYLTASVSCISSYRRQHAILNYTLFISAIGYFFIEIMVAVVFLYIYTDIPQWAFAIQLLLYVAYILLFGFVYVTNHKTNLQLIALQNDENLVNQWKSKAAIMRLKHPSRQTEELLDVINTTPINSSSAVKTIDEEISSLITDETNIDAIILKIRERNLLLKTNR